MAFNRFDVTTKELVWDGPAEWLERFGVKPSGPLLGAIWRARGSSIRVTFADMHTGIEKASIDSGMTRYLSDIEDYSVAQPSCQVIEY